jgi:hypothetical protein
MVFDQSFTHPTAVSEEAVRSLEDFRLCNSNEGSVIAHSGGSVAWSLPVRWQAPPCGKIKVNSDASLNKEKNCIGIRVVARDSGGCFLGGRCIYEQVLVDLLMAEVMAAMEAVTFSREVGFFETILEGDSLQIVKAINANTPNLSKIGHFVESIKTELRLLGMLILLSMFLRSLMVLLMHL